MTSFIQILKKRRSIYSLGNQLEKTPNEITDLVKEVVRESPSAFNSQTQRVAFLFGNAHKKLWTITEEALRSVTPAESFSATQEKLKSFSAVAGTILFFEDTDIINNLQKQFPLYADNFPHWSEQASGLTQSNVWTALAQENIGANLQHYNPLIDKAVADEWNISENWKLREQLVFGSIEAPAGEKEYMENQERFVTFD